MENINNLLFAIAISFSSMLYSQDIHYTNYDYSPLYLTPAKTGAFAGTYRIGANIRDQYNSFVPYQTVMAYADMPLAFGLKPYHWIGAGINIYGNRAGDLSLENSGAHISLSYHFAFDNTYSKVISLGLQYGLTQRRINDRAYSSIETLNGNTSDPDKLLLQNFEPQINDINLGVNYRGIISKKSNFDIGISLYHISQSIFRFSNSSIDNPVRRRINLYAQYKIQSTDQLSLSPIIVYSQSFLFKNLFGQFNVEYRVHQKSDTRIKGGIGYRNNDAVQFLAGIFYKGWDVGLSYDLTVSSASVLTNTYGALELGIKKIIIANKKPKVKQKDLCPRL